MPRFHVEGGILPRGILLAYGGICLSFIPRNLAAKTQPSHTLFMQQVLIVECRPTGISIRRKQIVHMSPSGLSWPLACHQRPLEISRGQVGRLGRRTTGLRLSDRVSRIGRHAFYEGPSSRHGIGLV